MRPCFTIADVGDYSILVAVDIEVLNDLLQLAVNKAYNEGYEDGQECNIKAE